MEIYDFHTHTFMSDGGLSPIELIRRAHVKGYKAIGITDHSGDSGLERIIQEIKRDCEMASKSWGITAIPGVELTHVPAKEIGNLAKKAKELGAIVVIVHGETPVEPVEPGTNREALLSPDVDILAHPGLITEEEAILSVKNNKFLEITARRGHSLTNGHVLKMARLAGASLIINSDAHSPGDILDAEMIRKVGFGSGMDEAEFNKATSVNPQKLFNRIIFQNSCK